jgi:hypothetical protein
MVCATRAMPELEGSRLDERGPVQHDCEADTRPLSG